jgi:BirA family biotin operon repressor/biotin-[acetyl-CoA-carboxylase] ligase
MLTPAYYVGNKIDFNKFPIGNQPTSYLINANDPTLNEKLLNITSNNIPVIVDAEKKQVPFDLSSYFDQLKTETLGRNLIIGDVIPTTMNLAHDFGGIDGLLVIANEQTQGRGSRNTKWQSPRGDHMITINLKLKNKSRSGLLPAHGALSMMKAVLSSPNGNYSELPIKFSWPISLHWSTWDKKIGGVLVEDIKKMNGWYASGCGVRINSDIPHSVSKIIDEYNCKNPGNKLKQLELAPLIARTMNLMEEYLSILENNPKLFHDMIIENWMNSDQSIKVITDAKVKGITEEGSIIFDDEKGFCGFLKPDSSRTNLGTIIG